MEITMAIMKLPLLLLLLLLLQIIAKPAVVRAQLAGDTIHPNETLADGQTLISVGRKYELGFFSPGNSKNGYLGIWFYNLSVHTVVWVANRATPLLMAGSLGVLKLTTDGNLILSDKGRKNIVWSTGTSNATNPVLRLLDSGNLVLTAGGANHILWQSFDHPGDTMLSGMKLGFDYNAHVVWNVTSWKSVDDPSPGDYYYNFETRGIPETFVWRGSTKVSRFYGPWNWDNFVGTNGIFQIEYILNSSSIYSFYQLLDDTIISRAVLNASGFLLALYWSPSTKEWTVLDDLPTDTCDHYAFCGANTICNPTYSPICQCLEGFTPKFSGNWNAGRYSDGCVSEVASNCLPNKFQLIRSMKMPDTLNATANVNKTLDQCRDLCLKNCSCTAYALLGATGCVTWFGDLLDIRVVSTERGNLFVRLPFTELDSDGGNSSKKKYLVIIITSVVGILLVSIGLFFCFKRRNWKQDKRARQLHAIEREEDEMELPLFDMLIIKHATNDFADDNILGKGGFGTVYKGELEDGQKIAVKRLSKCSTQGITEFRTEVKLIAKLQHRNLVRLLGYCVEEEERMLIYEFMQNGSLDLFIFDKRKSELLNWQKRLDIINGVARGLLYLHQDSRLKIIHRDLKTSNILLDEEMNPKISDFGMARILKVGQLDECTRRIVGTYGYMSPEYAMDGLFSEKSDVFSFGVILLQILSGKGNRVITAEEEHTNLLDYAWKLWKENRSLELVEAENRSSCPMSEVLRCIQVGLLCVQARSEDRPTMTNVVLMLANESIMVPHPREPGFWSAPDSTDPTAHCAATNKLTVTVLDGR